MSTMNKQKTSILSNARKQRIQEVLSYQINIDNYRLAIEHIEQSGDADLGDFKKQLSDLLQAETLEQKKAKVILAVIEKQLGV